MDLENIPEFYKLFNSGSLREHHAERKWLLELMHEGLRDSRDYRIYEKRYAFKLLMSYYQCSLATTDEKRLILQLLRLACRMKSSTVDLCKNYNLIGWISSVIAIQLSTVKLTETSLVPEEVADLSELLGIVWETVKEVKDERSKNEEEKKDLEGSQIGLPKYFICNFFACVSTLVAICCKDSNVHLTEINESAIDQLVNRLRTVKEQNQMV